MLWCKGLTDEFADSFYIYAEYCIGIVWRSCVLDMSFDERVQEFPAMEASLSFCDTEYLQLNQLVLRTGITASCSSSVRSLQVSQITE